MRMDYIERSKELSRLLTEYQKAYYVQGRPLVSDLEYDRLFDELLLLESQFFLLDAQGFP